MVSVVQFDPTSREFALHRPNIDGPELPPETLRLRVRQQAMLAAFGVIALKGPSLPELLNHAARVAAEGMGAEFGKVLKYMPQENRFLVCGGVGWEPGVVGHATIGADLASPAGYALHTARAVISNNLENEGRFRTPALLVEHGIRRAMNVILQGDGTPYGVLEVDSRVEGEFNQDDLVFLQGAADILGVAIERQRTEAGFRQALEHQGILLKEINHRVNNSLQIVSGMLHLQSSGAQNDEVRHQLGEASTRIAAIARAHQRLYSSNQIHTLDLGAYIRDVCADLQQSMPGCEIQVDSIDGVEIATDRAIPAALLVNELVTNTAKYAYPAGACRAWVSFYRESGNQIAISVRDEGIGLPPDFDLNSKKRLGMRLVNAFVNQLQGQLQVRRRNPGTEFILTIPLLHRA